MSGMISGIIIATLAVGLTGIIIAILLGIAGEKFEVATDEREAAVREALPGNNCGACGYPGCDGLAAAIVRGDAPVSGCPVGGAAAAETIAGIMGTDAAAAERMTAVVQCAGTCEQAPAQYDYIGPKSCMTAQNTPNSGPKGCSYGCAGYGDCRAVCPFGAIDIIDGVAVVNAEACKACGKCVAVCPRRLIKLIPASAEHVVKCSSGEKGVQVKKVCQTGCIACGLCVRVCPAGAIALQNNVARIDYTKCTNCGACREKCPVKAIS